MIKVNDKWVRLIIILVPFSLHLYNTLDSAKFPLVGTLIYLATLILICEGTRFLSYRSRRWFTRKLRDLKRVLVYVPLGIGWIAFCIWSYKSLRRELKWSGSTDDGEVVVFHVNDGQVDPGLVGVSIVYGILVFILLYGIFELAYHFSKSSHTEKERDRLEKEKLQAELQQLKGIINPHFLFNNLNSLSSLISENPAQAEAFLDELTRVFRYLLRNNETELTTLGEELNFLKSYYHLLQTRYGTAISLKLNIDPSAETYLLPPLTLQLLVENAVKHNQLHKDYPLNVELFNKGKDQLTIRNNLSIREQRHESTGIGLRSISGRYQLLGYDLPVVEKGDDFFSVKIPLIAPS